MGQSINHAVWRVQPSGDRELASVDGFAGEVAQLGTWDEKDQRFGRTALKGTLTCGLWLSSVMGEGGGSMQSANKCSRQLVATLGGNSRSIWPWLMWGAEDNEALSEVLEAGLMYDGPTWESCLRSKFLGGTAR